MIELSILFAEQHVKISDKDVAVRPFTFKELNGLSKTKALDALLAYKENTEKQKSYVLVAFADDISDAITTCTELTTEQVGSLPISDITLLVDTILDMNKDFFQE